MANPTTNFGWVMPTATDLVTDLPADFAVFGQGVDTSMADLLGGTTGQILAKTSNTNMDFTWTTPNPGDITGVAVTSPITGGGTSGDVTIAIQDASTAQKGSVQLSDSTSTTSSVLAATPTAVKSAYDLANAAIAKSLVTTAGDIIYRNATVPARLPIGTASQVLRVNSGATAPEWATVSAGALTQITQTILSSGQTYIDFTSIPGTYRSLKLIIQVPKTSYANTFDLLGLRFQCNSDSGANYYNNSLQQQAATISGSAAYGATTGYVGDIPGTVPGAGNSGTAEVLFNNYIGTTCYKTAYSTASVTVGTSAGNLYTSVFFSQWHNTSAITAIRLLASGDFQSGTVATLYGVS